MSRIDIYDKKRQDQADNTKNQKGLLCKTPHLIDHLIEKVLPTGVFGTYLFAEVASISFLLLLIVIAKPVLDPSVY